MPLFGSVILAVHCVLFWGRLPSSPAEGATVGLLYLIFAALAFWLEKKRACVA